MSTFKRYAMGYVLEYRIPGVMGNPYYVHQRRLSDDQIRKLPHHYCPDLDDPAIMFPSMEKAEAATRKYRTDTIRLKSYETPDERNAREFCIIKDEFGDPILLDDFHGPTIKEMEPSS